MYKYLNICNIYIVGWIGYTLLSRIIPGTMLTQLLLAFIMLVSIYYTINANIRYKLPLYFKGLNLLLIMFTVYAILYIVSPKQHIITESFMYLKVVKIEYLKTIYMSLLPIYPFYVFSKQNKITERKIRFLSFILVVIAIFVYYDALIKLRLENLNGQMEFTNNMGYRFVALLPMLFFWRKKMLIQYSMAIIIMAFIVMSMKRGAILIGVVCLCYFVFQNIKLSKGVRKYLVLSLVIIVIILGCYFVGYMLATSEYFQLRLQQTLEGNASNRQDMYPKMWDYFWNQADFSRFLVGGGVNTTIEVVGNFAHNDWFEIAINQGLLGFIIYIIYWSRFYKTYKCVNDVQLLKPTIYVVMIICLMSSVFSMSYSSMNIATTLSLGYCLSKIT